MSDADLIMPVRNGEIRIHDEAGFEGMRKAGRLVAECLDMLVPEVKPGVTTAHLDDLIREFVYDHGAQSATIGYRGYRHASCISLNHVICHGIPGPKPLKEGDIFVTSGAGGLFHPGTAVAMPDCTAGFRCRGVWVEIITTDGIIVCSSLE